MRDCSRHDIFICRSGIDFVPLLSVMKYGFDNEKYLRIQSEHIKERIAQFGDKLYLELGGKLFDDYHASRVLPGFQPDSKLRMLQQLSDCAEIVIVISANDIEKNKMRADYGITYDMDVLRLRTEFQNRGFLVSSVVITHFNGQSSAKAYKAKLKKMGIKAYYHYTIEGYPNNVALIDSEEGYGKNDYVQTSRPLVIVTAPGPGSGKMAVCLSQLYHEHKKRVAAGYAKFETFPVWNLPLKHPVNIASALDQMADGEDNESEVGKIALLLKQARITTEYRRVTVAAKQRETTAGNPSAAIELSDGTILSAETSDLLGPCAALLLKATKHLAGIDHSVKLIPGRLIEPIQKTKVTYLHGKNPRLHTDEVLIALSVLSPDDENCRKALDTLPLLKGCQVHSTVLLSDIDKKVFKKLGVDLTCEPVHERH